MSLLAGQAYDYYKDIVNLIAKSSIAAMRK